jgi:hypothetical protein
MLRGMSNWAVPDRADTPQTPADERTSLEAWLEYHRATLLLKCAGLEPEQLAIRSCSPSNLSLLGLVRHMTNVEPWFHDFDGQKYDEVPCTSCGDRRDCDFECADPANADADLAFYLASVERSRAAVAGRGLDEISPADDNGQPVSLRWVYQHMIEEYARHNGHADLIRERIDGATGD